LARKHLHLELASVATHAVGRDPEGRSRGQAGDRRREDLRLLRSGRRLGCADGHLDSIMAVVPHNRLAHRQR